MTGAITITRLDSTAHVDSKNIFQLFSVFINDMTYNSHVASTVFSFGQIYRLKPAFDRNAPTIIINSLVFSKLFHCSNVWSNSTESNLNRIHAVQNFVCRIISNRRKYDHVTPILEDTRWLPVRQPLYYRHATTAFKCMTGCAPDPALFSKYIERACVTNRTTRNAQMLQIPLYRAATGQITFYLRSVKLWNASDLRRNLKSNLKKA